MCRASFSNLDKTLLYNRDYTGFITRDFFQVVVEVPYSFRRESFINLRKQCKKDSREKMEQIVIEFLNKERKKEKKQTIKIQFFKAKYQWFLNEIFLFFEDYSQKETCIFTYRAFEKDLFQKVIKME